MPVGRLFRHAFATHWRTRLRFSAATLDGIEQAIQRAEAAHGGEIRFAIETALPPLHILNNLSARARALDVFSRLRAWDTADNNGVLIYVQSADRSVEIVADRGISERVGAADWAAVCRVMEVHFKAGRFREGSIAGVEAVGNLLARHFPAATRRNSAVHNQLPDRPTLL